MTLDIQIKNTLGEYAFQLCVANARIAQLTEENKKVKDENKL